jgi:hypothetical protein
MFHPRRLPLHVCWPALAATAFLLGNTVRAADEKGPAAEKPFRRLDETSETGLLKDLAAIPETGFTQRQAKVLYVGEPVLLRKNILFSRPDMGAVFFQQLHLHDAPTEFKSLPWRVKADARIDEAKAKKLNELALKVRNEIERAAGLAAAAKGKKVGIDAADLKNELDKFLGVPAQPNAVPALVQLLQPESAPVRGVLVDILGRIEGPDASFALARRAVFDLSPEIREKAVRLLRKRPTTEYSDVLVTSLRYPWPPAAYHAAEAIAFLGLRGTADSLDAISREPDPRAAAAEADETGSKVRELVRVNHLCNCLLCHAASKTATDPVRGRVPMPGEAPPVTYYIADDPKAIFAKADVTFLRHEFSVMHHVAEEKRNKWPAEQRYDYMVRERTLPIALKSARSTAAPKLPDANYNQKAALFALLAIRDEAGPIGGLAQVPAPAGNK